MEDERGSIIGKVACDRCGGWFDIAEVRIGGTVHGVTFTTVNGRALTYCARCDDLNALDVHAERARPKPDWRDNMAPSVCTPALPNTTADMHEGSVRVAPDKPEMYRCLDCGVIWSP